MANWETHNEAVTRYLDKKTNGNHSRMSKYDRRAERKERALMSLTSPNQRNKGAAVGGMIGTLAVTAAMSKGKLADERRRLSALEYTSSITPEELDKLKQLRAQKRQLQFAGLNAGIDSGTRTASLKIR